MFDRAPGTFEMVGMKNCSVHGYWKAHSWSFPRAIHAEASSSACGSYVILSSAARSNVFCEVVLAAVLTYDKSIDFSACGFSVRLFWRVSERNCGLFARGLVGVVTKTDRQQCMWSFCQSAPSWIPKL